MEISRIRKALTVVLPLTLVLVGCGGGAGGTASTVDSGTSDRTSTLTVGISHETTTLGVDTTTTTVEEATITTVDEDTVAVGIEDIPRECLDVLVKLVQLFEPVVRDVDWENATIQAHIQVANDLGSASVDEDEGCEDFGVDATDEESADLLLAVARREAPGSVGYFASKILSMTALNEVQASGDCLTDIAAMETIVAEGCP